MVPADYEEAFGYVREASDAGWTDADFLLALMYRDGTGTDRSVEKAEEYLIKAGEAGHPRAMTVLADMYFEGKYLQRDPAKAFMWYLSSAKTGNPKSQYQVASMLSSSTGTEKDPDAAREWYARYSETILNEFRRGAMDTLRARRADTAESMELLKASSRSLNISSMVSLASKYEEGKGVKRNAAASVSLLEKASAAGGSPRVRLGIMYLEGTGTAKDPEKAFALFRSAADYGDAAGMYRLAMMYKDGIACEESQVNYRMYMRMAAERGDRDARAIVAKWDGRIERRKKNGPKASVDDQ
jgi:TPR repeat protein